MKLLERNKFHELGILGGNKFFQMFYLKENFPPPAARKRVRCWRWLSRLVMEGSTA